MLSNRGRKKAISRMGRFAELRGELRWQLLFNGAKDGKPQCTIFTVFEVKRKFWSNTHERRTHPTPRLNCSGLHSAQFDGPTSHARATRGRAPARPDFLPR